MRKIIILLSLTVFCVGCASKAESRRQEFTEAASPEAQGQSETLEVAGDDEETKKQEMGGVSAAVADSGSESGEESGTSATSATEAALKETKAEEALTAQPPADNFNLEMGETEPSVGCEGQESFYSDMAVKVEEDVYRISGVIYQNGLDEGLIKLETSKDAKIPVNGTLNPVAGGIKLIYEDSDGTVTVLAESEAGRQEPVLVDITIETKSGKGNLYFVGSSGIYDFELEFGLSDDVRYAPTGTNRAMY